MSGGAMTPYSVLLVDDQPRVLHLLTTLIEDDQRFVLAGTATDGRSAVASTQRSCPDVVICDIQMPIMNGLEALPLMRENCPVSVIVMYTSDIDAARAALAAGADAVFDKAKDTNLLLDGIVELCSRGR
jgi:two-component system chemotaxis response regulator CheB